MAAKTFDRRGSNFSPFIPTLTQEDATTMVDPQSIGTQALVDTGKAAVSSALNSQSGRAVVDKIDQSKLKGIVKKRITELVSTKPIEGNNAFEMEGIVYSKPLELLIGNLACRLAAF